MLFLQIQSCRALPKMKTLRFSIPNYYTCLTERYCIIFSPDLTYHFQPFLAAQLNANNVLDYFSNIANPFYDRQCNNEQLRMQGRPLDSLVNMPGIEYTLHHYQEPVLYIIQVIPCKSKLWITLCRNEEELSQTAGNNSSLLHTTTSSAEQFTWRQIWPQCSTRGLRQHSTVFMVHSKSVNEHRTSTLTRDTRGTGATETRRRKNRRRRKKKKCSDSFKRLPRRFRKTELTFYWEKCNEVIRIYFSSHRQIKSQLR